MTSGRERDAIVPILERAGVPRDGTLVVHSAIGQLSRKGYRAEAMIESFLAHLEDGTLIMPTMTWRTVTPDNPIWDELTTASETGIMSEIFRTRFATARSIHPTHSVAALGATAVALTSQHHLDDTPVSAKSPYGLMRTQRSYVMMIGIGLESCTAIHLPEETIAPEVYLRPLDRTEVYSCRDRGGRVHRMHTRRHWRLDRDFPKFGPLLAAQGRLLAGDIDGCRYAIVGLQDLLEVVTDALVADKNGTLKESRRAS